MALSYDEIHTAKKQRRLAEMMEATARALVAMQNSNPLRPDCPICGGEAEFFVTAFQFRMDRCGGCGLIFCNPYPSECQVEAYYNSEMKAFENEFFRDSFEKRVQLFLPRVALLRGHVAEGDVLDIGSAIGLFVEAVRRAGAPYRVTCCDLSAEACAELKTRYPDVEVLHRNALGLAGDRRFDLVTLWDTIEHIVDQRALLRGIHALLAEGGLLAFSTPNTDSFEWRVAGDRHVQLLPPGHVNLLSPASIRILLAETGFETVEMHTLNPSLDISYVRKLVEGGDTEAARRLGPFLAEALTRPDFAAGFAEALKAARMAGNVLVLARRIGGRDAV
jgi:2-polyprenyl-3-methyl-5-hydroxy-6-metoxy-1,4-benzoquinol methylase